MCVLWAGGLTDSRSLGSIDIWKGCFDIGCRSLTADMSPIVD